ncbi:MAG: hypothetical protein AMXMBFR33_32120 [Candidatus Xenobia bacterium]
MLILCLLAPVWAEPRLVSSETELREALRTCDHIVVLPGHYLGQFVVDRTLVLEGRDMPVLDGGGKGTVLTVNAPDVTVRGFEFRGSGVEPEQDHSGVTLNAPRARVERNRFREVLFGVVVSRSDHSVVRDNDIQSKPEFELGRKGDGIRVWYSQGVVIEGNRARDCRDLVAWYSSDITFRGNHVSNGRYGVHFMYCDRSRVEGNVLEANSVGIYTMYSRQVDLKDNRVTGCRGASGYALGFKDADDVEATGNVLVDSKVGLFLDSTPTLPGSFFRFTGNVLAFNDAGVALFPSVKGAKLCGNSFNENAEQVRLEGGGQQQGNSFEGNYWSDYTGCDLDGDGRGDQPYRSQKLFESLAARDPSLRLFQGTLVQMALDSAARLFPLVAPQPKLEDPSPSLAPPVLPPPAPVRPTMLGWAWPALTLLVLVALRIKVRPTLRPKGVPAMNAVLKLEKVTKKFGRLTAVDGVSLEVKPGQAVALWGANGAGKTTLMRCLLGLLSCEGKLLIGEFDAQRQGKKARALLGYVPQELSFHDDLSVAETLELYATLRGVRDPGQALARVGLDHCPERKVGQLSGGMKQRLALALALLGDPPLLLLDEPTSNLDLQGRQELLHLLGELRSQGKTMLFTSHRLDEVLALADRVVVLERGKVTLSATPAEMVGQQGWQTVMKLRMPSESLEQALELLVRSGFAASRNGTGLWVEVPGDRKASPIQTLARAGIVVTDFEI